MPYIDKIEANGTLYDIQPTNEQYFYRLPDKDISSKILFPQNQLAPGVTITNRTRAFYERLSTTSLKLVLDITVANAQTNAWLNQVQSYDLYTSTNQLTPPSPAVIWHPESEFIGTDDKNLVDCWFSSRDEGDNHIGTIHIDARKVKPKIVGNTFDFVLNFTILWFGVFSDYIAVFSHAGDDGV